MFKDYKIFLNRKSTVFQYAIVLLIFSIFTLVSYINISLNQFGVIAENTFYDALYIFLTLNTIFFVYIYLAKALLKDKFINPLNTYITLNIIFLLLLPSLKLSIVLVPLSFIITIITNRIVRYNRQPIFNPAALGIFISFTFIYLLNLLGIVNENIFVSWWGANLIKGVPPYNFLFILLGLIWLGILFYYAKRNNKLVYGATFTLSFIIVELILALINNSSSLLNTLDDFILRYIGGNLFFFGLVMLVEPKTSPTSKIEQFYYGIITAILYANFLILLSKVDIGSFGQLNEIFIILIMNLIFFISKRFKEKQKMK